jgi:hypothetical protein
MRSVAALITIFAASALASASPVAGTARAPTLGAVGASVVIDGQRDEFAGKTTIRVRFCAEIGPHAVLLIRETRKTRGSTKASASSQEPLGVDLDRVQPYGCVRRFVVAWLVPAKLLRGTGTYSVTVRLRDGRGRLTRPIGFSLRL